MSRRPNHFYFQHMAAFLALSGIYMTPAVAVAQTVITTPTQQTVITTPTQGGFQVNGGRALQRGQGQSLSDILEKLDWDPSARGTLLIVSPEEAVHFASRMGPMSPDDFKAMQELPEPEAGGKFRLSLLADFYHRRLVNLPTVSVFAPALMSVLNSTHLPKPDPYAGMTSGEKARLLESTFTPEQWRAIASPDGIGAGDMKKQQRDLFLSMLPDPFVVSAPGPPVIDSAGVSRPSPQVETTLTEDQRESIRFSLARKLTWSLKTGTNGRMGVASDQGVAQPLRLKTPMISFEPTSDVFGVGLVNQVPSRLKPSQLPADWPALDKPIDLAGVATVADLVQRITKQTGAELYCDPRYRDLKLYIRGTSAKASDLCRALAWGVTGTWRRLGEAFVLTDDLVGLGVRHALIDNWVRENALLAEIRVQQVDDALAKSHSEDYIGWSANDATKPDDALKAKIDAYQTASKADNSATLLVPTKELSQTAQDLISGQIAQQEAMRQRRKETFPNFPGNDDPIQPGVVYLSVDVQPTYTIPGVGNVIAADLRNSGLQTLVGEPQMRSFRYGGAGQNSHINVPPALGFPSTLANRVVVVEPKIGDDIAQIAREAHRAGFTQLWVKAGRDQDDLVMAAIQAGSANGLLVQAMVPLARPAPAGKPDLLERNILGETLTEYAKRWRSQMQDLRVPQIDGPDTNRNSNGGQEPIEAWRKNVLVDRMLRDGDFLRCGDPDAVSTVASDVARTASIAGLGGIVFCDIAAPGFNPPLGPGLNFGMSDRNPGDDPLLSMGYEDSARLGCLRKNGFDPIDLSPLISGDQLNLPFNLHHSGQMPTIGLPFFRDFGPTARNASFNGQSRVTMGAKDAAERWAAYRQDLDAAFVAKVADAARAKAPTLPIMVRRTMTALDMDFAYYGTLDPKAPSAPAPAPANAAAPKVPGQAARSRDIIRDAARAASRTAYQSVNYNESVGADEAKRRFVTSLPYMMQGASNWDGIVVDLTDVPTARAVELLSVFPDAPAPAAAPKPN